MSLSKTRASNVLTRLSPALRWRLVFLALGNSLLIGYVFAQVLGTPGARIGDELSQFPAGAAPLLLAGLGLTGIVLTGGIDLSIGSIVVVCGTVFGILFERGASPGVCFIACCASAMLLSCFNSWMIRRLAIPAIIVTLGTLTFYRGFALVLARWHDAEFSGQFSISQLGKEAYRAPGVHAAGWILLAGIVVALFWEAFGKLPRLWLAVGNSPEGCRLAGVNPETVKQSAFVVGGFFLGLGALVFVTKGLTIEPNRMARNFELEVIGAVVLGGTNVFGGEGSYLGTLLGGCLLYFISKAILYAGVSEYWQIAVQGALILAVIGLDCVLHRQRKLMDELR